MATHSMKRTVLIVTAGQSGCGKSTAMNNIFGANFKEGCSPSSVTVEVEARCVDGCKDELIVVDTPGLGATDINIAKYRKDILNAIGGLNFVLVYCYSVSPGNRQSVADQSTIKNLQKILGKEIWKKCVVLFTFSDFLRVQQYPREEDRPGYKAILRCHADKLSEMFHKICGAHAPDVKMVFDIKQGQESEKERIAVPVGRHFRHEGERHLLLPGLQESKDWRACALTEIIRKAEAVDQPVFWSFSSNSTTMVSSIAGGFISGAIGGVVGGVIGGMSGLGAGIVGSIPGVVVGTGAGIVTGVLAGGSLSGSGSVVVQKVQSVMEKKEERDRCRKVNELQKSPHVHISFAQTNKEEQFCSNEVDPELPDIESSTEDSSFVSMSTPLLVNSGADCRRRVPVLSVGELYRAAEEPET